MRIDDINEYFNLELSSEDYESIGGLILENLGHLPIEGEECDIEKLHFIVEKMDKNRMEKLRLYL